MEVMEAKNWYKAISSKNKELSSLIKGMDLKTNSVIINNNQRIPVSEFEKMNNADDVSLYLTSNNKENITTKTIEKENHTLNDLSILTELGDKDTINRILQEEFVNAETGEFEIGKYFNKFYNNTKKEVVSSILNKYELSDDLNDYSIDGKFIGEKVEGNTSDIIKISKGVKNNVVALKAIGTNKDKVRIDDNYINTVKNKFIDEVTAESNLLKNKDTVEKKAPINKAPEKKLELKKEMSDSEPEEKIGNKGIADIFVLTVIILVYAVIIINLIMKLN